ncbi:MarR family transcriptional regulator [Hydrogenophaga sp.]|uniref:MarR family winged helix-turn-helix transcriptional regulator n=1 Tax=Hydrogenophaga sp. TaxID=1904254 RepID=UPI0025C6BCE8|nr:MarR family transcriptional regulator [Hydrogenophaga sp.]
MLDPMPAPTDRSSKACPRPSRKARALETVTAAADSAADNADGLDTSYLESLLGYNARRTALAVIGVFLRRMAPFELRPVDFSVLTLIAHNPGATSRQICAALDIQPPNLVGLIRQMEARGLVQRKPHPTDRRAQGLHLSAAGKRLQREAQAEATALEQDASSALCAEELKTLKGLLRKVYLRTPAQDTGTDPG